MGKNKYEGIRQTAGFHGNIGAYCKAEYADYETAPATKVYIAA